jgi:hypothetical protein
MKANVTCAIWRGPGAQSEEEKIEERHITGDCFPFFHSRRRRTGCGEQTTRASLHTEEASNRTETTGVVDAVEGAHRGDHHSMQTRGRCPASPKGKEVDQGAGRTLQCRRSNTGYGLVVKAAQFPSTNAARSASDVGIHTPLDPPSQSRTRRKYTHIQNHTTDGNTSGRIMGMGMGSNSLHSPHTDTKAHRQRHTDINGKKPKAKKGTRTKKGDTCWQPGILILKSLAQGGLIVPLRWEVRPFHRSLLTPSRELESFPLTWLLIPPSCDWSGREGPGVKAGGLRLSFVPPHPTIVLGD